MSEEWWRIDDYIVEKVGCGFGKERPIVRNLYVLRR
jgi:hypothetical protein